VSTLREILVETRVAKQPRATPIREQVHRKVAFPAASVEQEQIHALVQQLFFRHESALVRQVGFAPVEGSTATAALCFEVARTLTEEGRYDVGLIDAHSDPVPLQTQLEIPTPDQAPATWPIGPRLWMVPRQSWREDSGGQPATEQDLSRLRDLMAEFDFSILWCPPVSWLTVSIGRASDGLVLVLAANKTRRLVAAQVKEQLSKAQVPLLGTVLAERRFPVPQGLYQSL
jgi:hypothetical protein